MILALLLAAAAPAPMTAIDAERAFNRDAQKLGQWTAFRKWAAPDAIMFTPQPVRAHVFLKDRKNPPLAVKWWPSDSFVSCDGHTAINRGPWVRDGGKSVGYFTTVWSKRAQGWHWELDHGDALAKPLAASAKPRVRRASCRRPVGALPFPITDSMIPTGSGTSRDTTIAWWWSVEPKGARNFRAYLWTGRAYEIVLDQKIAGQ